MLQVPVKVQVSMRMLLMMKSSLLMTRRTRSVSDQLLTLLCLHNMLLCLRNMTVCFSDLRSLAQVKNTLEDIMVDHAVTYLILNHAAHQSSSCV